ncbi:RDD family protein [Christiangramia fulva]|uniref:RDD family protein n=1 Tax=Christiangramia fulva TaxID=2126553 RepID=A0A2R3Z9Z5_9FLAO|nr:RDD family protein [Christiangramia fulva]AVR47087.1 RDD family protein [Christiangramia fulva]
MIVTNTKPHLTKRIIATLIDYGIYYLFVFVFIMFFGEDNEEGARQVTGALALIPILVWFIYFVLFELTFNATLGHQLFELEVRNIDGSKIEFTQALRRRLLDFIDICMFGIPAIITIKNTEHNQRLGDLWANTKIIKVQNKKADVEVSS